ncbi:MAG: Cytochrome c oxidase subunit 5A [Cirrosporium novae-zelandiae]|nr:MAG: Cytochrome c oxidase subunit 5A [Cirrosporium novae-zelandiae]
MLRTLPRASSSLVTPGTAAVFRTRASCLCADVQQKRNAHAISNPTLAGIEKRWEGMPPQDQAQLWVQLRDRMKVDWHQMTMQEKKAAYWIAFGPHGPRALDPPGEGRRVLIWTLGLLGVSAVLFGLAQSAGRPAPSTMTKEWQEMTDVYLKEQKVEPITGIASEGYKGTYVTSPPAKKA